MKDLQKVVQETLLTKSYSVREADLTYRTVNHWSSEGLVDHFRKGKGDWHKLCFLELVEILIYKELRDIGFSIPKMKKLRSAFVARGMFSVSDLGMKASSFLIAIIKTLLGGNFFLVLDRDGEFYEFCDALNLSHTIASSGESKASEYFNGSSLLIISLRKIFANLDLKTKELNEKFSLLVKVIKEAERQSINIEIDAGQINKFENVIYANNCSDEDIVKQIKRPNQKITFVTDDYGGISAINTGKRYK